MSEKYSTTDNPDFWAPFGEPKWRELGAASGCSEAQLKFSVARFNGASATAAAKIGGYKGQGATFRRIGYDVVRSTAVQHCLELASLNSPSDAGLTDREVEAKLAKLVRSPDSNIALKAIQIRDGRMEARRELEAASGDTQTWDEAARELLAVGEMGVGLVAVHALAEGVDISYSPLREIAPHIKAHWPDIWEKMLSRIERINPGTMLKWVEYGDAPLVDLGQFGKTKQRGNGAAEPEGADAAH